MSKISSMTDTMKNFVNSFIKKTKGKEIKIISHYDTDGITAAAIFAKTLQRLDKKFSIIIIKQLEKEMINLLAKLPENKIIIFLDLGSSHIQDFSKLKNHVFILDHHEINKKEKIPDNVEIINPHLLKEEEEISAAGLAYLFSKEINLKNKDLANLAIIGMVGDMLEQSISKINNKILNDAELIIKKGLLVYPSTRPLNKALEFSSNIFIPGVTGNSRGAINILKEAGIGKIGSSYKNLIELEEEEMSRLITAILLKTIKKSSDKKKEKEIIGNIYLVKFFNKLEDARGLSAMINACSRLGYPYIAISLCLGNRKAKKKTEKIYAKYRQHIVSALNYVSTNRKIEGKHYTIINAKDNIKDTMTGTIASILSKSSIYKEGTIIITMAYANKKIKVSARIAGRNGRNIREVLDCVTKIIGGESGGHALAAGCLIEKQKENKFIEVLRNQLEIETIKV